MNDGSLLANIDMKLYRGFHTIDGPAVTQESTAVTIGNFDGLHRGHQALLETLKRTAQASGGGSTRTALITFDPHPLSILRPTLPLELLTTPKERVQLAALCGIDIGVILPFTRELAALEATNFLSLLKEKLAMKALVVGPDFAMGRNRSGTLDKIAEIGSELDFTLVVQEHVTIDEQSVRSATIRSLLAEGDVSAANELLGRPYHVIGDVIRGEQLGRTIGIPTANLQVEESKLWPAHGVYASRSWVFDGDVATPFFSVTNIGVRPTVNGNSRRLESHLLDFPSMGGSGDLYDCQLAVEFIERLRGEKKFASIRDLQAQIQSDIEHTRQMFERVHLDSKPFFTIPLG